MNWPAGRGERLGPDYIGVSRVGWRVGEPEALAGRATAGNARVTVYVIRERWPRPYAVRSALSIRRILASERMMIPRVTHDVTESTKRSMDS